MCTFSTIFLAAITKSSSFVFLCLIQNWFNTLEGADHKRLNLFFLIFKIRKKLLFKGTEKT